MSRENAPPAAGVTPFHAEGLESLRKRYELWNEGGTEAMIRESWAPDIVYHDPPDFPDATTTRGAAALADHLNARLDAVPHARFDAERAWWVRDGEIALVEVSLHVSGQKSGVKLDRVPIVHLFRLDEKRRVVELREFTKLEQALEAVGLRE